MQLLDYLRWAAREIFSSEKPQDLYDSIVQDNFYERTIDYENRVARFRKAFQYIQKSPQSVLDLACGTGAVIDALPNKKRAKIVGVDISEGMLSVAKKRFRGYQNIRLMHGSFMDVVVPKKSFDLITIAYATRFIPKGREDEFARKVVSLLKDDGVFVVFTTEDPFMKLSLTLSLATGLPRGYNLPMNYSHIFTTVVRPYFRLEHQVMLRRHYQIYSNKALFFRKK